MAYVSAIDAEVDKAIIDDIRKETGVLLSSLPKSPIGGVDLDSDTRITYTIPPISTDPKSINSIGDPAPDNAVSNHNHRTRLVSLGRNKRTNSTQSVPYTNPKKTAKVNAQQAKSSKKTQTSER
jgi:hypothetical protein